MARVRVSKEAIEKDRARVVYLRGVMQTLVDLKNDIERPAIKRFVESIERAHKDCLDQGAVLGQYPQPGKAVEEREKALRLAGRRSGIEAILNDMKDPQAQIDKLKETIKNLEERIKKAESGELITI